MENELGPLTIFIVLLGAVGVMLLAWWWFGDSDEDSDTDSNEGGNSGCIIAWCFKCQKETTWNPRGDRSRVLGTQLYRCGGCGVGGRFNG